MDFDFEHANPAAVIIDALDTILGADLNAVELGPQSARVWAERERHQKGEDPDYTIEVRLTASGLALLGLQGGRA